MTPDPLESTRRHRILFVVGSLNDLRPGCALRELHDALLRQQQNLSVVVLQAVSTWQRQAFPWNGNAIKFIPVRFAFDLVAIGRIRNWAKQQAATLVHSWGAAANRLTQLAAVAAPWHLVCSKTDLRCEPGLKISMLAVPIGKTIHWLASHQEIVDRLRQSGISPSQLKRLQIGAPLPPFADVSDRPPESTELRETFRLAQDWFLIGIHADLVPRSRIKDLIWATDLLQCVRDDFRVLLFGHGPQRWRLQRFARQATVDSKVIFVDDLESNWLHWLPELDLYWHAYRFDPHPFNIVAALRAGCPVLAPEGPGLSDLIDDQVNGLLFDEGQRDQIARKTNALFNDRSLHQKLKQNAANTPGAVEIADTVRDLIEAYESIIRGSQ